jgi:glycosyltransferase involved in cell wall biosynthesis
MVRSLRVVSTVGWMPDHPAILQISKVDVGGGAAQVARNLFDVYRARGYPAWLAVGTKSTDTPGVIAIPNDESRSAWARGWRKVSRRLGRIEATPRLVRPFSHLAGLLAEPARRVSQMRGREDFDFPGSTRILGLPPLPADVLHAHNLHRSYFDLRVLPKLTRQVPVLLTLHDAWLLSGHCAHSLGCERWKTGCGACPDLTLYPSIARDATAYNWARKRAIYRDSRLYVATPSRWLMRKVEQSILAPAVLEARVLPNGVDLRRFLPGDRDEARRQLGLDRDAHILLTTGTRITQNVWKDYPTLKEAARIVADTARGSRVILLVVGDVCPDQTAGTLQVRSLGYEDNPTAIARYYQAADVYLHAARADTFPSAILEALACGTPVVATAVGGIGEQIADGHTGLLASAGDARALAAHVTEVLANRTLRRRLSAEGCKTARERFDVDAQADSYLRWYESLVSSVGGRTRS